MIKFILFLASTLFLCGCSTPEYRNAKNECSYEALRQHPINNVASVVSKKRPIQVPTGQTNCTTTYLGYIADTQCTQVMRTEYVPYQETVVIDTNENARESAMNFCAARLCYNRFGNAECKSK